MATAAGVLSLREAARPARSFDWRRTAVEFLLVAVPLIVAGAFLPAPVSLLAAMVLVVPLVWKAPVRGVYFLVAAAVIVEIFPLRYPDSLTDRIPLFENLSNVGISGISASPVEVLMIEIGLLSMARARSQEGIALRPRGPLVKAYIFFAAVLLAAEVHGLFSGGDIKLSLWELRPQGYGFVMFMLAGTLVRTRRQVITLGVVTMLATALKAVLGAWRWQFTLNHSLGSRETLLAHEDSYFMGLFVVAVVVGLVYWRRRSTLLPLLVAIPLVTICLLANQRRAGVFALAAALAVVALIVARYERSARKVAIALAVVGFVAGAVFIAANWNKEYGLSAQLVRPVRSLISPSYRDLSSDTYRTAEDNNLRYTFKQSPLAGMGFGLPFLTPFPQADISNIYSLWNVIPHNTLLWVPMRMGVPGMVTFWGLIGMAILEACWVARGHADPFIRGVAVFVVAALAAELVVAYGDLQLESYRNMIFLGSLLGVLVNLPRLAEDG